MNLLVILFLIKLPVLKFLKDNELPLVSQFSIEGNFLGYVFHLSLLAISTSLDLHFTPNTSLDPYYLFSPFAKLK